MSIRKRLIRTIAVVCALSPALLALAPAGASASERPHFGRPQTPTTFGYTSLTLNPSTASTLTKLGLTVTPIAPASVGWNGAVDFPITNPLGSALVTGQIDHSGGIAISNGQTTVDLENFDINIVSQTLSADVSVVNGSTTTSDGRVTIVNLSFAGSSLRFGFGGIVLGPVTATLNSTALTVLGDTFGLPAVAKMTSLPLGTATVNYRLF